MKAYELEQKKADENNWILGLYIESAVSTAFEHNLAGNKAKSKYLEKPFLQMDDAAVTDDMTDEELDAQIRKAIAIEDYNIAKQKAQGMKEPNIKH